MDARSNQGKSANQTKTSRSPMKIQKPCWETLVTSTSEVLSAGTGFSYLGSLQAFCEARQGLAKSAETLLGACAGARCVVLKRFGG